MKSETGQSTETALCIRGSCWSFRNSKENYLKVRHKEGGPKFNPPVVRGWFQRPPSPAVLEGEGPNLGELERAFPRKEQQQHAPKPF